MNLILLVCIAVGEAVAYHWRYTAAARGGPWGNAFAAFAVCWLRVLFLIAGVSAVMNSTPLLELGAYYALPAAAVTWWLARRPRRYGPNDWTMPRDFKRSGIQPHGGFQGGTRLSPEQAAHIPAGPITNPDLCRPRGPGHNGPDRERQVHGVVAQWAPWPRRGSDPPPISTRPPPPPPPPPPGA